MAPLKNLLLVTVSILAARGLFFALQRSSAADSIAEVAQLRAEVDLLVQDVKDLRRTAAEKEDLAAAARGSAYHASSIAKPPSAASATDRSPLSSGGESAITPFRSPEAPPVPPAPPKPAPKKPIKHVPGPLVTLALPPGRFAYVSLMANCDIRFKYRVYLSGILVFAERTRALGSKADIVVLVNFKKDGGLDALPQSDLDLLAAQDIKIKYVDSVWERFLEGGDIPDAERAAEKSVMYNKIFAWEMTEYEMVQYVDADVMPNSNMDVHFARARSTFIRGWMSPLQGGWYLLKPDLKTLRDLVELVKYRYSIRWDARRSFDMQGERPKGDPPCLDDDQGLFWCYFRFSAKAPPIDYVDHKNTRINGVQTVENRKVTATKGKTAFDFNFEHFGGRYKPWRVCSDPSVVRQLKSIAQRHASHWPPTKLAAFKVYCETFDKLELAKLVGPVMQPIK